jgi:RecA-family ATPase
MPRSFRQLYNEPLPENPCWIGGGVLPKGGILLLGGLAKIGKTFV